MADIKKIRNDTRRAREFFENKIAYTLGPVELKEMLDEEDVTLIDVRKAEDYDEGHIKNAISIPKKELEDNFEKLSKDKINIVYCYTQQCHLAAKAAYILAKHGYPVMELDGGIKSWRDEYKFETFSLVSQE